MLLILHKITKDNNFSEIQIDPQKISTSKDRTSKLSTCLEPDVIDTAVANHLISSHQGLGAKICLENGESIEVIESKSYIDQMISILTS